MRIWKNGKEPPYMYGSEKLTREQILHATMSMNYSGLQTAAASFLLLAQKNGKTPKQLMDILEAGDTPPSVKYTPELGLEGGNSATEGKNRQQWR